MIISHKYKFIFIKNSKTAGTSLELFLDSICGSDDVLTPFWEEEETHTPRNYSGRFNPLPEIFCRINGGQGKMTEGISSTLKDWGGRRRFHEALPAWQIKSRVSTEIWNSYYKFAVERNPWDKVISRMEHWNKVNKIGKVVDMDQFLDWFEGVLTEPWITIAPYNFPRYVNPWTGEVLVDQICKYEQLDSDLSDVFKKLSIPFEGTLFAKAKGGYRQDRRPYWEVLTREQRMRIEKIFKKEIDLLGYTWGDKRELK